MTNEQILAAIAAIAEQLDVLKAAVAVNSGGVVVPPEKAEDSVVNGPDESGRVQFAGTVGLYPKHWFLTPWRLAPEAQTASDSKAAACITANCFCTPDGKEIVSRGAGVFAYAPDSKFRTLCYDAVPATGIRALIGQKWQRDSYPFADSRTGSEPAGITKVTVATQHLNFKDFLADFKSKF